MTVTLIQLKFIDAWPFDQIFIAVSQELKQEVNLVFKQPYIIKILQNQKPIRSILGRLFNKSLMVLPKSINKVVFPDETDHFLLELAITAKAPVIVTGNKGLLSVKHVGDISILNPKQFCLKFKIT